MKKISKIAWITEDSNKGNILFGKDPRRKHLRNDYFCNLPKDFYIKIVETIEYVNSTSSSYNMIIEPSRNMLNKVDLVLYDELQNIAEENTIFDLNLNSGFILMKRKSDNDIYIVLHIYTNRRLHIIDPRCTYIISEEEAKSIFSNKIINKLKENKEYVIDCKMHKI